MINFKFFLNFLIGIAIGFSSIIPGVSGGTTAFVLGVYHKLIDEIGKFTFKDFRFLIPFLNKKNRVKIFRKFLTYHDWSFLFSIGFGVLASVALFTLYAPEWIAKHDFEFRAIIFGFILASLYFPLKNMKKTLDSFSCLILFFVLSVYIFYSVDSLGSLNLILGEKNLFLYVIAGVITSLALVVPGISGAYLLILFGLYTPLLKALAGWHLSTLSFFALGLVIGFFIMTHIMRFLFKSYFHRIQAIVIGIICGSLISLWPFFKEEMVFNEKGEEFIMYSVSTFIFVFLFGFLYRKLDGRMLKS